MPIGMDQIMSMIGMAMNGSSKRAMIGDPDTRRSGGSGVVSGGYGQGTVANYGGPKGGNVPVQPGPTNLTRDLMTGQGAAGIEVQIARLKEELYAAMMNNSDGRNDAKIQVLEMRINDLISKLSELQSRKSNRDNQMGTSSTDGSERITRYTPEDPSEWAFGAGGGLMSTGPTAAARGRGGR